MKTSSISFLTATTAVSQLDAEARGIAVGPRQLDVLGHDREDGKIYALEHFDDGSGKLPQLHFMRTRGWLAGRLNPVHSWYLDDGDVVEARFLARLVALRRRLTPLRSLSPNYFRVSTRVKKRRAVRLERDMPPVRQYDLQIAVRPVAEGKLVPMGARKQVRAYLRPRARLREVWGECRGEFAVAVVSYVGIPYDLGYDKETVILL